MIEVLKQAREALEDVGVLTDREWQAVHKNKANELRQAIAELESQEPVAITDVDGVAWAYGTKGGKLPANKVLYDKPYDVFEHLGYCPECGASPDNPQPHPPQRTWVGLTDDEIDGITCVKWEEREQIRAIEAKLKERNDHSI